MLGSSYLCCLLAKNWHFVVPGVLLCCLLRISFCFRVCPCWVQLLNSFCSALAGISS